MKKLILPLLPNRVRRNYTGGAQLDALEGNVSGIDGNRPEDWIGSTVKAVNSGMPEIENEGISKIGLPSGETVYLDYLLGQYPEHYLGNRHFKELGANTGFLAKLLDPSMRLHVQAHPTAEFARKLLKSRYGKLEVYIILGIRNGYKPAIRLGFQRAPSKEEWKRIVIDQDIRAMDACFDDIPVSAGDVWVVKGGIPHAIGGGILMVEVMEPSDWVFRCEFEREGIVVPEKARFLNNDPELSFEIFDYKSISAEEVRSRFLAKSRLVEMNGDKLKAHRLVDKTETDCFSITRVIVSGEGVLNKEKIINIGIVVSGEGEIRAGDENIRCKPGSKFLLSAKANEIFLKKTSLWPLEIIFCQPNL